jgi:hypothetical protein
MPPADGADKHSDPERGSLWDVRATSLVKRVLLFTYCRDRQLRDRAQRRLRRIQA